jgi:Glyoxalase/Bleomycin resistance protein/Dioxygenase superfamily
VFERSTHLFQVGWLVNDLEAAINHWITAARVGPFFIVPHVEVKDVLYRGAPAVLDFSAALAQAGPIQIELIEQHSPGPSAYRDVFAKGEEGLHHLATMTSSFHADVERHRLQGSVAVTEGFFGDMRFAYVDTRAQLGHMTEIIEDRESIKQIFKTVADASIDWDGSNPIRYF